MSALSQILGNHGSPHVFEHEGKTYSVRMLDQNVKDEFEKALFGRARSLARLEQPDLSEEQFASVLLALNDKFLEGEYALESKKGLAFLNSTKGQLVLSSILFGVPETEMVQMLLSRGIEVAAMLKLVIDESLPKRKPKPAEGADPNPPAPGQ